MTISTPDSIVIQTSQNSPMQILENLKELFETKEITLFALIDHSGEAKKAGLLLQAEQLLIFGDPKTGTFLMQENPAIGLELPLKILIWQDREGSTKIAYKDPTTWLKDYGIQINAGILVKMKEALSNLIDKIK